MWKRRLVKVIVRVFLIFAASVILTLLTLTLFYEVSNIGTWTPKDWPFHWQFVNFKIILLNTNSIKIIYWYMVGVLTLESLIALIFKNPLALVTDSNIFTGLEDAIVEEIMAYFKKAAYVKDSGEPKVPFAESYGGPKEDKND